MRFLPSSRETVWAALLLAGWSCSSAPQPNGASAENRNAAESSAAVPRSVSNSLRLRVEPGRDEPLTVVVTVHNDGEALRLFDEPQFYSFVVMTPSGTVLEPEVNRRIARISSEPVLLEQGGSIRREFHLLCGPDGTPGPIGVCDWRYVPTGEGVYRVMARYEALLWGADRRTDGEDEIVVESDTVRIAYSGKL